jgi:hypothetical protein
MDPITAFQGLLSFLGINAGGAAAAGAAEAATAAAPAVAQPAVSDIAIKMGGFDGLKKAGTSLLDPSMALQDKFNVVAPEAYKQSMSSQADFAKLQQGAQPMQMPSYARQSSPFQGGGIEEILQRQRGLLR